MFNGFEGDRPEYLPRGDRKIIWFSCHRGTNILGLSPKKTCYICYITVLHKSELV